MKKHTQNDMDNVKELLKQGFEGKTISELLGISRSCISEFKKYKFDYDNYAGRKFAKEKIDYNFVKRKVKKMMLEDAPIRDISTAVKLSEGAVKVIIRKINKKNDEQIKAKKKLEYNTKDVFKKTKKVLNELGYNDVHHYLESKTIFDFKREVKPLVNKKLKDIK